MLIIYNRFGNWLQAPYDQFLYFEEAIVHFLYAKPGYQIQFHSSQVPLTTKFLIIIISSLLDGNIRQVHVWVWQVFGVAAVLRMSESAETLSVEVDR